MKQNTYGIIPHYLFIILFYLFLQPASAQTVPTNPSVSLNITGTTVNISWSADNADTYILYAAPYPDASVIYDFDMGNQISVSFDLPADSAYYVAIKASNSSGMSDWSNIEYFDLSQNTPPSSGTCGAYVAPGAWKEFGCYNLAAIGKTTNDDPFTPSWRLIGGYWQWGRKGADPNQWYDTNSPHFAYGPTASDVGNANSDSINGWDGSNAPNGAWSDAIKTTNDPCPDGYRVPTKAQWDGVRNNNTQSIKGVWSSGATNYSTAQFFGSVLMLPAAGFRDYTSGALNDLGGGGYYWSSSEDDSNYAWNLSFFSGQTYTGNFYYRRYGLSVRCIAE